MAVSDIGKTVGAAYPVLPTMHLPAIGTLLPFYAYLQ